MPLSTPRDPFVPLADKPEQSRTLPSWVYRDPEILQRERERIFHRSWMFIAHQTQVRAAGDYVTGWVDDQSVFVIRGKDGALRGFHNACRHRAHELLCGEGSAKIVTCPYHAWSYHFDGRLRTARGTDKVCGFAASDFALKSVRVETLAGLVFVNLDNAARPLAEQAPHLEASLLDFIPGIEALTKCHETIHDVRCNWKVMIDNSLECYHCEPCHPGFAGAVDMDRYRSVSDGIVTIHTSQRRGALEKFGDVSADDARANEFSYWYIWPTTEIDATPGLRPRLSVFTRQSLAPNRFRLIGYYFRRPDDIPTEAEKAALAQNKTLMEDVAICESVQRGLASRGYSQGRFIVDAERSHISEHSVHHFQRLVAEALDL